MIIRDKVIEECLGKGYYIEVTDLQYVIHKESLTSKGEMKSQAMSYFSNLSALFKRMAMSRISLEKSELTLENYINQYDKICKELQSTLGLR